MAPWPPRFYDLDKPLFSLPDTRFHLDRLSAVSGRILEPACGSGRTLVPLLDEGHDAVGFDRSPDMLERCRARCAAHGHSPHLSQQSFDDFRYTEPFAAIVVPMGTFGLVDDHPLAVSVLRRFHRALAPGGLLILDLPPLGVLANQADDRRSWETENGDLLTLHGQRVATDWVGQRLETRIRYERWRDNALIEAHLEPMSMRAWGLEEMRQTLVLAGFSGVEAVGNYDRRRPPRANDRMLTFDAARD